MKPRKLQIITDETEFIFPTLDTQLNKNHYLFILSDKIDWDRFDRKFSELYNDKGRPATSTRIMVGLLYLKYIYNLSDDEVLRHLCENVYFQYFCGFNIMQHKPPCDTTTMVKWRQRIKDTGIEEMLAETLAVAHDVNLLKLNDLKDVNLDTTVQPKNISYPTDVELLNTAREQLVKECEKRNLALERNFKRIGKFILIKAKRYAHAKQFKRAKKMKKKLKSFLKKVLISARKYCDTQCEKFNEIVAKATKILCQEKTDKNKIYSFHEPTVECIGKGKAHKPYEFGCKVSVMTTNKSNFIVGIIAMHGNPYDGHTTNEASQQMVRITGKYAENTYVDLGYRGSKIDFADAKIHITGTRRGKTKNTLLKMKRRSAVEPVIGHLKFKHRMGRNFLKGRLGDKLNALLAGCGKNLWKIAQHIRLLQNSFNFTILTTPLRLPKSTVSSKVSLCGA